MSNFTKNLTKRNRTLALEARTLFDGSAIFDAALTLDVDDGADIAVYDALEKSTEFEQAAKAAVTAVEANLLSANRDDIFSKFSSGLSQPTAEWNAAVDQLQSDMAQGKVAIGIAFLTDIQMNGDNGAFSAEGQDGNPAIFLNRDWIEEGANSSEIESVIADQLNEFVSARLLQDYAREVAFVDGGLTDVDTLLDGIPTGVEVHLVEADINGLDFIASTLANVGNVSAIHILGHGSEGELTLGTSLLNANTVDSQSEVLADIGEALTVDGDILLYGCSVAAGENGQALVEKIANLTKADIAASDDLTGGSPFADWNLEVQVGKIDVRSLEIEGYLDNLAIEYADLSDWNNWGKTGSWFVQDGSRTVLQTQNTTPATFFLAPEEDNNVLMRSTIEVNDSDNDFIGFVFGYKEPDQSSTTGPYNFLLFDWRQSGGDAALKLSVVKLDAATGINWSHSTRSGTGLTDVVKLSYADVSRISGGQFSGWQRGETYQFEMLYTEERFKANINGITVVDVAYNDSVFNGTWLEGNQKFQKGYYGFYNLSQPQVTYGNVQIVEPALNAQPPVANNDYFGVSPGSTVTRDAINGLFSNDYDVNLDEFNLVVNGVELDNDSSTSKPSSTSFNTSAGAQVTVNYDGSFSYKAGASEGSDSFDYKLVERTDSSVESLSAKASFGVFSSNNAPTDIALTNNIVGQGASVDSVIGTFSTTDPDVHDKHDYLLIDDTANKFKIVDGVLKVANAGVLPGSYTIKVRTVDLYGASYDESFTITVQANNAPASANNSFIANTDSVLSFKASDFTFSDTDGDSFAGVKIISLPSTGTLRVDGIAVTAGQVVSDISKLTYTPINAGEDSFTFAILDSRGALSSSVYTSSITVGTDSDKDGVLDSVDIDDDNDGILDINESTENFQWANGYSISGNTATGTIGGTGFTYTLLDSNSNALNIQTTTEMFEHSDFPSEFGVPNDNPTIKNTVASKNTLTFDSTILNPVLAFSSIGNPSTPVGINFGTNVEVLWYQKYVNGVAKKQTDGYSTNTITANEGDLIVKLVGEYDTISFDYTADETYVNFAFGADIRQDLDTDGDGIVNRLDTDSDGDGVLDNVEAQDDKGYGVAASTLLNYVAPSGKDIDNDGLDDAYDKDTSTVNKTRATESAGLAPVDVNSNGIEDYLLDEVPELIVGSLADHDGTKDDVVVIAPYLTITDVENNDQISEAKVQINNLKPGDTLKFADTASIKGSYNSNTGVLTLSGQASSADYEKALRTVSFSSNGAVGSTLIDRTDRQFSFTIGSAIPFSGNGHFYEFIEAKDISWSDAKTAAEARTLYGMQGYLATITSAEENDFVAAKLAGNGWIGASDAGAEGVWKWVTGPEAGTQFSNGSQAVNGQYENWAPGEPNDYNFGGKVPEGEEYIHFWGDGANKGTWNDFPNAVVPGFGLSIAGYIVEYGGYQNETNPTISGTAVMLVNDAPVISSLPTSPVSYKENGASVQLAPALKIVDTVDDGGNEGDDTFTKATVRISSNSYTDDTLSLSATSGIGDIKASYDKTSFTLTLTGKSAVLSEWQTALRSVKYSGGDAQQSVTKSIEWFVYDASLQSNKGVSSLSVTAVNDAPVINSSSSTLSGSLSEVYGSGFGTKERTATGKLSITDVDAGDTVRVASSFNNDIVWSGGSLSSTQLAELKNKLNVSLFNADTSEVKNNSVQWSYSPIDNVDLNFLADGDTLKFSFDVVAVDKSGAESASETISLTLKGTPEPVVVTVENGSFSEGDGYGVFVIDNAENKSLKLELLSTLSDGYTATLGTDYKSSLQYSLNNGQSWTSYTGGSFLTGSATSVKVRLPIIDDTVKDAGETLGLKVTGTEVSTKDVASVVAKASIGEAVTGLTIEDVVINEGANEFEVFFKRPSAKGVAALEYTVSNGEAKLGSDFAGTSSGKVVFAAGETVKSIKFSLSNDGIYEGAESFYINVSAASLDDLAFGEEAWNDGRAKITIVDDGSGNGAAVDSRPSISIRDVSANESDGELTFTIEKSHTDTIRDTVVTYDLGGLTARYTDGDYDYADLKPGSHEVVIKAGETSATVRVKLYDDKVFEGAEQFSINILGATHASVADNQAIATIYDDGTVDGSTSAGTDSDDRPVFSVEDITVNEADGVAYLKIVKTGVAAVGSSVYYETVDGSALVDANDFTPVALTEVVFGADDTEKVITVDINDDDVFEGDEAFTVALSGAEGAVINASKSSAVVTIKDDGTGSDNPTEGADDRPTFTINSVAVNEADGLIQFTVTLEGDTAKDATVNFEVLPGVDVDGVGAADKTDYAATAASALSGSLTFKANESKTQTITLGVINDDIYEESETFFVKLSSPVLAKVSVDNGVGTGEIRDDGTGGIETDNDLPVLTIQDVTISEGNGKLTFTVTREFGSTRDTLFDYIITPGSATLDDFSVNSPLVGQLSIAAGDKGDTQTITVDIADDSLFEAPETINISILNPVDGSILDGDAVGYIQDNDAPSGVFAIAPVFVNEASDYAAFYTVTPGGSSTYNLDLKVDTGTTNLVNPTILYKVDDNDWVEGSSISNFVGSSTLKVLVDISGEQDAEFDSGERFDLVISYGSAANDLVKGEATILDDGTGVIFNSDGDIDLDSEIADNRSTLTINSVSVGEGGEASLTLTRDNLDNINFAQTVNYTTLIRLGDTAESDDFTAVTGSVTFAVGETTKTVKLETLDDDVFEGSETFSVELEAVSEGIAISDYYGTVTITDDGSNGGDSDKPTLAISDSVVEEGGTAEFTLSFSKTMDVPFDIAVTLNDVTTSGSFDYSTIVVKDSTGKVIVPSTTTGLYTVEPGNKTLTVSVLTLDDDVLEGKESFTVAVTTANPNVTTDDIGKVTIADDGSVSGGDDDRPEFSIADVQVNEFDGTATFTITKTGTSNLTSTIAYATADGAAKAGSDYVANSGVLEFGVGETTKVVTVDLIDDAIYEGPESFSLKLSSPTNAVVTDAESIVAISDQEDRTVTVSGVGPINENSKYAVFEVEAVGGFEALSFEVFNISASLVDVEGKSDAEVVYMAPGEGDKFYVGIEIANEDDKVYEGIENFGLRASYADDPDIKDIGYNLIVDGGDGVRYDYSNVPNLSDSLNVYQLDNDITGVDSGAKPQPDADVEVVEQTVVEKVYIDYGDAFEEVKENLDAYGLADAIATEAQAQIDKLAGKIALYVLPAVSDARSDTVSLFRRLAADDSNAFMGSSVVRSSLAMDTLAPISDLVAPIFEAGEESQQGVFGETLADMRSTDDLKAKIASVTVVGQDVETNNHQDFTAQLLAEAKSKFGAGIARVSAQQLSSTEPANINHKDSNS